MPDEKEVKKQREKITLADLKAMKAMLRKLPKKRDAYTPSQAVDDLFAEMLLLLGNGYSLPELYATIKDKICIPLVQFERAVKSSLRKRVSDKAQFNAFWKALEVGTLTIDVDALPVPEPRNKPKATVATLPEKSEPPKPDSGKAGSRLAQTAASRRQATG